jgi:hypothetical protein
MGSMLDEATGKCAVSRGRAVSRDSFSAGTAPVCRQSSSAVCREQELEARDKDERDTQEPCDTRDKKKQEACDKARQTRDKRQETARRATRGLRQQTRRGGERQCHETM